MPSPLVFRDAKLYLGGRDLTGFMNVLGIEYSAELQDNTVFGDVARSRLPGALTVDVNHHGWWDEDADADLFAAIGSNDEIMSLSPDLAGVAGQPAFFFKTDLASYVPGAAYGEVHAFDVTAQGSGLLVKGTVMENRTEIVTANGTIRNLGSVSATQSLYAAIHVVAVGGTSPTLDVTVESDDAVGFASPITRITFPQFIAVGASFPDAVLGPITDDEWRITWTTTGSSPSFQFFVSIGIQ